MIITINISTAKILRCFQIPLLNILFFPPHYTPSYLLVLYLSVQVPQPCTMNISVFYHSHIGITTLPPDPFKFSLIFVIFFYIFPHPPFYFPFFHRFLSSFAQHPKIFFRILLLLSPKFQALPTPNSLLDHLSASLTESSVRSPRAFPPAITEANRSPVPRVTCPDKRRDPCRCFLTRHRKIRDLPAACSGLFSDCTLFRSVLLLK